MSRKGRCSSTDSWRRAAGRALENLNVKDSEGDHIRHALLMLTVGRRAAGRDVEEYQQMSRMVPEDDDEFEVQNKARRRKACPENFLTNLLQVGKCRFICWTPRADSSSWWRIWDYVEMKLRLQTNAWDSRAEVELSRVVGWALLQQ